MELQKANNSCFQKKLSPLHHTKEDVLFFFPFFEKKNFMHTTKTPKNLRFNSQNPLKSIDMLIQSEKRGAKEIWKFLPKHPHLLKKTRKLQKKKNKNNSSQ